MDFKPITCRLIGTLYLQGDGYQFPQNIQITKKYFDEAENLNLFKDNDFMISLEFLNKKYENESLKGEAIKSTEETQAIVVSNFLNQKII